MKSQVLHTVWCNISGEAAGGNLKLITLGSECNYNIYSWTLLCRTQLSRTPRSSRIGFPLDLPLFYQSFSTGYGLPIISNCFPLPLAPINPGFLTRLCSIGFTCKPRSTRERDMFLGTETLWLTCSDVIRGGLPQARDDVLQCGHSDIQGLCELRDIWSGTASQDQLFSREFPLYIEQTDFLCKVSHWTWTESWTEVTIIMIIINNNNNNNINNNDN